MVTMVGTQNSNESLVKSLLNLEHDAIEAYDETIERLEDSMYAQKVSEFKQDHLKHVEKLSAIARQLGVEIPDGTAKAMLTKGKIVIADLMGDDAILMAMKTNEYDTVAAYENALKKDFLTAELRACCEQGLADERKHRDWMDQASKQAKAA
jgi:rubrerythrin